MLLMAPRRNHNNSNSSIVVHQQQLHHHPQQQNTNHPQSSTFVATTGTQFYNNSNTDDDLQQFALRLNLLDIAGNMSPMQQTTNTSTASNSNNAMLAPGNHNSINTTNNNNHKTDKFFRCCQPNGECFKPDTLISPEHGGDCVRVICNNENCSVGQYMHRACFDAWEQNLLATMKSQGSRARSWTERQRAQNLWTKKGYDLVYKACGCKCGRGHIRKDTEWMPSAAATASAGTSPSHKHANGVAYHGQQQQQQQQQQRNGLIVSSPGGGGIDDDDKKKKKKRNRNSNSNSSNGGPIITTVNGNGKQQLQQQNVATNGYNNTMNGGQLQQQQQQQQNSSMTNGGGGGGCSPTPNPNVGVIGSGLHHNNNSNNNNSNSISNSNSNHCNGSATVVGLVNGLLSNGNILGLDLRDRTGSLSSSSVGGASGSTSPSDTSHGSSGELVLSSMLQQQQQQQQQHQSIVVSNGGGFSHNQHVQQLLQYQTQQQQQGVIQTNGLSKSILNSCVNGSVTLMTNKQQQNGVNLLAGGGGKQLTALDHQQLVQQQKVKEVELYSERVRFTSGCNGIFSRRLDFSSFNLLPKTRLNSYQVKIEDEGNHGNDETRLFILSSLAQSQMSRVACILCEESMLVFDRYPLVDGSFFLSPKQHSPGCIEVKYEGRALYLTCVCMSCLDGTSTSRLISCRFCAEIWDGSNLVLGTMYAYDIFAAMPCCAERLKCNNCFKLLLPPQQRLNFYSDYSHFVTCPYCNSQDTHFVKPLSYCYTKSTAVRHHAIA